MSERMEESLSKSMREKRMPEMKCLCLVVLESGETLPIERYARDFAELWYLLFAIEKIQKLVSYKVTSSNARER